MVRALWRTRTLGDENVNIPTLILALKRQPLRALWMDDPSQRHFKYLTT